jgi:hypothetical protein
MNARRDPFSPGRAAYGPAKARGRFACLWLGCCCVLAFCTASAGLSYKQIVTPSGPITKVVVGEDGSLQIEHEDYPSMGQFYPSSAWPADCGFFLRHDNIVVGMDYLHHNGGTAASGTSAIPFQPISQTQSTDGCLVNTVMDNSNDGTGVRFKVSQDVSYWPGDAWVFVRAVVKNESAFDQTVDLFAAADIYAAIDDAGYAYLNLECPQVAVGGINLSNTFSLFLQGEPGSSQPTAFQEAFYGEIWRIIGSGLHFTNTIIPYDLTNGVGYVDNGAGLEWKGARIPAGGSLTIGYYWAFSPVTCMELTDRAQPIHVLWSGGTNMILRWDQPGYFLQASTNCISNWHSLSVPITDTETTVGIDRQQKVFYRLARP